MSDRIVQACYTPFDGEHTRGSAHLRKDIQLEHRSPAGGLAVDIEEYTALTEGDADHPGIAHVAPGMRAVFEADVSCHVIRISKRRHSHFDPVLLADSNPHTLIRECAR
jgi:hypothetical protein